jgi:hypothetical protein
VFDVRRDTTKDQGAARRKKKITKVTCICRSPQKKPPPQFFVAFSWRLAFRNKGSSKTKQILRFKKNSPSKEGA